MKKLLWLGLLLFPVMHAMAQADWTRYTETPEYAIDYKLMDCNQPENGVYKQYYILRFTNKGQKDIEISFNRAVWYNGKCSGCENGQENTRTLLVLAQSSIQGDCDTKDKTLFIFNKMLDNTTTTRLEKFELRNIQVTTL